jgi:hypothetical protein
MKNTIKNYKGENLTIEYSTKDQNLQDETTVYWFNVGDELYGVSDKNGEHGIVDCDGCPVNTDDAGNVHLEKLVDFVTDEIRYA